VEYLKSVARGLCLWNDPGLVDLGNSTSFLFGTAFALAVLNLILAIASVIVR